MFGGSRVRGDHHEGSDIDVGFGGLTGNSGNNAVNKITKAADGAGGGPPVERGIKIFPGNETPNVPKIESPEEFFGRSGTRTEPGREGEPFHPSGSVTYNPDGSVVQTGTDGTQSQLRPPLDTPPSGSSP